MRLRPGESPADRSQRATAGAIAPLVQKSGAHSASAPLMHAVCGGAGARTGVFPVPYAEPHGRHPRQ